MHIVQDDNNKMDLKKMGWNGMDLVLVAQNRGQSSIKRRTSVIIKCGKLRG